MISSPRAGGGRRPESDVAGEGVPDRGDHVVDRGVVDALQLDDEPVYAQVGVPACGVEVGRTGWGDGDLQLAEGRRSLLAAGGLGQGAQRLPGLLHVQTPAVPAGPVPNGPAV